MPAALTLHGIDKAVSNLGYKNANSPKARLIRAIRAHYTDPTAIDKIQQIEQEALIRQIWGADLTASALRSRRKNLASVRSSVNADLKKLFDGNRNPEGITINSAYVFDMLTDAKDRLLSSLGNTLQPGENVSLTQIAKMLDLAGQYLESHDHQEVEKRPQGLEELKAVIGNLTRLVDSKSAPPSASEKNQRNFNSAEDTAPGESLSTPNKITEKNRNPENDQTETPFSNRPLPHQGAAENDPPGGPATGRSSDSRESTSEDTAADESADFPKSNVKAGAAQTPEKREGELLSWEGPEAPAKEASRGINLAAATPSISSEAEISVETPPPSPAPSQESWEVEVAAPSDKSDSSLQNNTPSSSENISGGPNSAATSIYENSPSSETSPQDLDEIVDIVEVLDDGEEIEEEIVEEDAAEFDSFEDPVGLDNEGAEADAGHGQGPGDNGGSGFDGNNMLAERWEPAADGSLLQEDDCPTCSLTAGFEPEPSPLADTHPAEDSDAAAAEFSGSNTGEPILPETSEEGAESGDSDDNSTSGSSQAIPDVPLENSGADGCPVVDGSEEQIQEDDEDAPLELVDLVDEDEDLVDVAYDDALLEAALAEGDSPDPQALAAPEDISGSDIEAAGPDELVPMDSQAETLAPPDLDLGKPEKPGPLSSSAPMDDFSEPPPDGQLDADEADLADDPGPQTAAADQNPTGLDPNEAAPDPGPDELPDNRFPDEDAPLELVDLVDEDDDLVDVAYDDALLEAALAEGDSPDPQALAAPEDISGSYIEAAGPDELVPMDSQAETLAPPDLDLGKPEKPGPLSSSAPMDDFSEPPPDGQLDADEADLADDPGPQTAAAPAPDDPPDSRFPTEIGLPFDPLDQDDFDTAIDPEDLRSHRLLAEKFDGFLGVMERYYNQYLLIPEKKYVIGSQNPLRGELEAHAIRLPEFYLAKFPVTNALFEVFVDRTGYVTTAEKRGEGTVYRGRFQKVVDPESGQLKSVWHASHRSEVVKGACWYQPFGPGSTLHNKRNHPVVQVSLKDALAFAAWTGKRLPREVEWEAAARTAKGHPLPWGRQWREARCNTEEAGIADTTPVDDFTEGTNALGISDCLGNVLEWTIDEAPPIVEGSGQPALFVAKGGSWISESSVRLYSRFRFSADFCANILGFRCLAD